MLVVEDIIKGNKIINLYTSSNNLESLLKESSNKSSNKDFKLEFNNRVKKLGN